VTSPLSAGPHRLLAQGAALVRGTQDVLDLLFGRGARSAPAPARGALTDELEALLRAISEGHDNLAALARAGLPSDQALASLSALELAGYIRREAGGRYTVVP
jgi:DNA processing protein